jgi:putative ABC transport system permease protein
MTRRHSLGTSGLFLIVRRSLRQHALSTTVTVASVALACGLVMAVFSIADQTQEAFTGGRVGYDAVLGARGSQLQLVLNTVFHLETSPGNIPWNLFETIRKDPRVSLAIPYAVGDNYHGFRIVGTTDEIFTRFEYQPGRKFVVRGRPFDSRRREAVIGSYVAQETGLALNSKFNPYHGLTSADKHPEEYVVVGVLEPTNTPSDRVIWIPIEGIFRMSGHVLRGSGTEFQAEAGKPIPDDAKEVSAVMLSFKNQTAGMALDQTINKQGKVATLAWPIATVMSDLFNKMGWVNRILTLVAYLVVLVAAGSILASIYNSMNERRREFAILRALGARRRTVFSAIVFEAMSISALGAFLGYVVYAAILAVATVIVRAQTGVVLDAMNLHPVLCLAPVGMIGLGALSGLVPAWKAYSTDVATNLAPHS